MIVDTSFLISFYDEGDSNHLRAVELMRRYEKERLLINDYVIGETATVLLYKKDLETALQFISIIEQTGTFKVIHMGSQDFASCCSAFRKQKNQMSFIDASVVYLARLLNDGVATFDENILKEVDRK